VAATKTRTNAARTRARQAVTNNRTIVNVGGKKSLRQFASGGFFLRPTLVRVLHLFPCIVRGAAPRASQPRQPATANVKHLHQLPRAVPGLCYYERLGTRSEAAGRYLPRRRRRKKCELLPIQHRPPLALSAVKYPPPSTTADTWQPAQTPALPARLMPQMATITAITVHQLIDYCQTFAK